MLENQTRGRRAEQELQRACLFCPLIYADLATQIEIILYSSIQYSEILDLGIANVLNYLWQSTRDIILTCM